MSIATNKPTFRFFGNNVIRVAIAREGYSNEDSMIVKGANVVEAIADLHNELKLAQERGAAATIRKLDRMIVNITIALF